MNIAFSAPSIIAFTQDERLAADIFSDELAARIGTSEKVSADYCVKFQQTDGFLTSDEYEITINEAEAVFSARDIRGLIFAVGHFLRKCIVKDNSLELTGDISGKYSPEKAIRGHQIGYRQTSNTYDAWDIPEYRRYCIDMMFFGANTCEHIPYEHACSDRNAIMRRDEQELLCEAAAEATRLGMDVSVWYPNCEKTLEEAEINRDRLFSQAERLDYIFPPGGDPGDIQPQELMERCKSFRSILRKYHPDGQMWPSAQQPHHLPDWGTKFLALMNENPDYIDGVITGPNAAFPLDILRRHLPARYPIRLYPDITHNLRCEYPVHFDRDDWHYALAAVNGRESINPRPAEYKKIHSDTKGYVIGSVSYSEGVNDDINKAVWSALEFDSTTPLREILEDYSRLFFPRADYEKAADGIFGLEKNWEGAPEENPCIESTLSLWEEIGRETPSLADNWRYVQCLFRARCDAFVRRKVIFENSLIRRAARYASEDIERARSILLTPLPDSVTCLYSAILDDADKLFRLIGLQSGTEKYFAKNFERGAVLDTIKLPVTDLPWLLSRFDRISDMSPVQAKEYISRCFNRNRIEKGEYYYSVALDGICPGGVRQNPYFYMNIQADRPDKNDGTLPTALFKLFDHFSFKLKTGGLDYDTDYTLMITYRAASNEDSKKHTLKINGKTLYSGQQFGGKRNTDYENDMLPDGFIAVEYAVPAEYIINGCVYLEISEKVNGFEIAELRFTKKPYKSLTGGKR